MTRATYDAFLEEAEKNRDLAAEAEERFQANSSHRDYCDELLVELDNALLALDHPDFIEPRNWVVTKQREVNQERASAAHAASQAGENHAAYMAKAEMFAKAAARVKPSSKSAKKSAAKDEEAGVTTAAALLGGAR